MSIVAIDPGGTSGIAVTTDGEEFQTCTYTTAEEVWSLVALPTVDAVVIERFATSDYLSKYGLLTIEIVGGVKALCQHLNKVLVIHVPQNRYSQQDLADKYLKELGIPYVIHESDALAHLFYYLKTGK
jgi:hypothetical protein